MSLFALAGGLFPFWTTRFVARGKEGAIKTGIFANLVLAFVTSAVYLSFIVPIMNTFGVSNTFLPIYLLATLQIVNTFLIAVFEASLRAVKPQAIGFGLLIEELVKVSLAYVLIVVFNQLLLGAMISLIAGAIVQTVFYFWLLKDQLKGAINWSYLREWLRGGSVAFVYSAIGSQLMNFLLYILVYYSGQAALGYYQAAVTFSTVIGYAFSFTFALYPKMLSQECPTDISDSLKTMLMLALPIATITLTMSSSLLTVLKTDYAPASPILMLLTFDALVVLISQFYSQCLLGLETLDIGGKISLVQLARSKIFKVYTMPYVQAAIALPLLYYALTKIVFDNPIQAALVTVGLSIGVHFGAFISLYLIMRKSVKMPIQGKSLIKFTFGAVLTGLILAGLPQTSTLLVTFGKALLGVTIYSGLLYAIDSDARKLVSQVFGEIRGILFGR